MRISDWSSDVCSSDLLLAKASNSDELIGISKVMARLSDDVELQNVAAVVKYLPGPQLPKKIANTFENSAYTNRKLISSERFFKYHGIDNRTGRKYTWVEIGRASCRERGCQYGK